MLLTPPTLFPLPFCSAPASPPPPQAEVLLLGRLQHPNLVRLLGYSTDRDEAILVYEFLEGGSLDTWLFQGECF